MSRRYTPILTAALLLGASSLARAQAAAPDSMHRQFHTGAAVTQPRRDLAKDRAERAKDDSTVARYRQERDRKRSDLRVDREALTRDLQALQRDLNAPKLDSAKVVTDRGNIDNLTAKVLADSRELEHKQDQLQGAERDILKDSRGIKADKRRS
jgi:hypothetical protein